LSDCTRGSGQDKGGNPKSSDEVKSDQHQRRQTA
jgi:hypothetical protein